MNNCTTLKPSRTVVTNFATKQAINTQADAFEDGVWVLHVCGSSGTSSFLSCALTNGEIQVYDSERLQLLNTYNKCHGDSAITDLTTGPPHALVSSGQDGSVALFDVRQSTPALQFQLPKKEQALTVSLGYDGGLAAVGSSKAQVHFFDLRSGGGTLLGSYQDAHTEEVTRVRFQRDAQNESSTTPLLVSASEDGLACVFDTSQPSEEAALKSVLNVQTPLRQVGFFGPQNEGIYCLTGSETMSVWHYDSAQRICDFGMDLRDKLSKLTSAGAGAIDYLVDCQWDVGQQQLSLLAGNHAGDGAMFKVDAGALSLQHVLESGHKGVIRSWCGLSSDTFVTVGEDARLCEWNRQRTCQAIPAPTSTSSRVGGPIRRTKQKPLSSPY